MNNFTETTASPDSLSKKTKEKKNECFFHASTYV